MPKKKTAAKKRAVRSTSAKRAAAPAIARARRDRRGLERKRTPASVPPIEPRSGNFFNRESVESLDDERGSEARRPSGQAFPIAGLGASAGGLEALTQLLEKLPADTGMALVVVQHLDPQHHSILAELLQKATPLPVVEATEGVRVTPNNVYVIPPNKAMEIRDGVLKLWPRAKGQAGYRPIDNFFYSLAAEQRNRAIGVILSGTASDGTLGLKAIKEEGGITFAQDRESSKFDSMPAAAVASGSVDFVLPPGDIARELAQVARHPYVSRLAEGEKGEGELNDERLDAIFRLLRTASGVDFTYYKHSTLRRRILRRMMLNRIEKVQDYIEMLRQAPAEVTGLYNDILIHVTEFFRDAEVFEALKESVLPQLIKGHSRSAVPLRIWVPGCAAGEEAYSIAMCLLEACEATGEHPPVQIFATDISEAELEKARAGIYPEAAMTGVSAERRRRYFAKVDGGGYQVAKILRDMCLYARQDLGRDPPFSRIDLISCRNVLIYLSSTLQKRVIPAFHYALKPEGYLLLGSSESIGGFGELFTIVDKQHRIYRKKAGMSHPHFYAAAADISSARHDAPPITAGLDVGPVEREADRMLLGRYSPPGVLINETMTILQFRGQTGRYLEPAAGTASLNLMKMARPDLQMALRKLITESLQTGAPTRLENQRVRIDGTPHGVTIEVLPVGNVPVAQGRYFMVLFFERPGSTGEIEARPATGAKRRRRQENDEVMKLRQELVSMREYLQSVIEEQEAANEELRSANEEAQSTNEELQSINEELETAKEELQSTNEELTTINEELENVNQELSEANNDLKNLLDGVDVAIVMLSSDLRIRRFTPPAAALLNLIATDVGRPLADLRPNIEAPELAHWITGVTEKLIPARQVVKDHAGRDYDLRIKPYRTADNKIDGVVISIFERGGAGAVPG